MEKFTPSELCADIKIYDYKKKVKYDEKSLVIFEKTGKMITAGKECEGMLYTLPADSIGFSPIVLGRVSDYTCAEKMLKQMLCRYLGKASFTGYGEGLIFIHEKLNEVEMKAYFDLLYQAGAKNVVYADDLVDYFGVDAVRYYVLHEMPFENDGNLTWELVAERTNSDLANTLGNLVNRTISMSNKYFGGVVENRNVQLTENDAAVDADLKQTVTGTYAKVVAKMEELRVADALTEIFGIFKRCNKYIDETEPWVLAKDEAKADRLATVLYNLVEGIIIGASLLEPYMPETAEKIAKQLNTSLRDFDQLEQFGLYESGNRVTDQPEILFARLDMKDVAKKEAELEEAMIKAAAEHEAEEANAEAEKAEQEAIDIEPKTEIEYDDFAKMQFQVGEIISCEAVPKSKKLLCSQVKIGSQVRQIVSGIKAHYSPEEMVGKKVMVLVNLKPAKLAGVMSEGMILCAEDAEGNLALVTPEKNMPAGAEIC